jgi:hypothetical protein
VNADIASAAAIAASKISGLATVATTGSYTALTDKPAIPAAQVAADWTQATTTAVDFIKNKPALGSLAAKNAVASADITNLTIIAEDLKDGAVTTAKILDGTIVNADIASAAAIAASKISGLATVATTGSYTALTDKPAIPAAQVAADWTQATTTAVDYIKNKPTLGSLAAKNAVASADITDGTILTADLASGAVTSPKLSLTGTTAGNFLKYDGNNWVGSVLPASNFIVGTLTVTLNKTTHVNTTSYPPGCSWTNMIITNVGPYQEPKSEDELAMPLWFAGSKSDVIVVWNPDRQLAATLNCHINYVCF